MEENDGQQTAVWWIRRDLRLADNQALAAAMQHGSWIIPVFILDPALLTSRYSGPKRLAFLFSGLERLQAGIEARGGRLIVRQGRPRAALEQLLAESGATAVFAEADFSPYARQRDRHVQETVPLQLLPGLTVYPPDLIRKKDGDPYTVYTPFSKAWRSLPPPQNGDLLPAPRVLNVPTHVTGDQIPESGAQSVLRLFPAGEEEAQRRLSAFTSGLAAPIYDYSATRNLPAEPGTSQLSPYLRFGMISARTAAAAAYAAVRWAPESAARKSADAWLNELIWREFYISILHHFPFVRRRSFRAQYDAIVWDNDKSLLKAWQEGHTGYPIVDAAMRQLLATGWMHNRTRMVAASFLVKDLLIDWRLGELWFMQHLIDGDPAANNGGWQWTAGVGTDAAPYFRIFNPILQSKKFDAAGVYLRRWLPELANVPDKYIHEPWTMPDAVQKQAACVVGVDYPAPVINHYAARERTLAAYKATG
jgi:deoxyribodipyrimidine photo-lyase